MIEILLRDAVDVDVEDIHLFLADKIEQESQRPFKVW
jgi:hypothetical protein